MIAPRLATAADRSGLVRLGAAFHAAAGLPLTFSPEHASRTVAHYTASRACLALVLPGAPGAALRGGLLAHVGQSLISPDVIAQELALWIDPQSRGALAPVRALIADYEAWARSRGATVIGLAGLGAAARVGRLYARLGYSVTETHFSKAVS